MRRVGRLLLGRTSVGRKRVFSAGGRQSTKKYAGYVKFDNRLPIQSNFGKTPANARILEEEVHRYGKSFANYYMRATSTRVLGWKMPRVAAMTLAWFVAPTTAILVYWGFIKGENNAIAAFQQSLQKQIGMGIPRSERAKAVSFGHLSNLDEVIRFSSIFVLGSIGWAAFRTRNIFRAFVNSPYGRGLSFEAESVLEKKICTKASVTAAIWSSLAYTIGCLPGSFLTTPEDPDRRPEPYVSTSLQLSSLWGGFAVFTAAMVSQPFIFVPFICGFFLLPFPPRTPKVAEEVIEEPKYGQDVLY